MFFRKSKLKNVEDDIFLIKQSIFKIEINRFGFIDHEAEKEKKEMEHRLNLLETKRQFIISSRDAWVPRTIWNVIVPILVSVISTLILFLVM